MSQSNHNINIWLTWNACFKSTHRLQQDRNDWSTGEISLALPIEIDGFWSLIYIVGVFNRSEIICSSSFSSFPQGPGWKWKTISHHHLGCVLSVQIMIETCSWYNIPISISPHQNPDLHKPNTTYSFQWNILGVSENKGTPKWMVKIMENPIKMGWFGGKTHYFWKHPYSAEHHFSYLHWCLGKMSNQNGFDVLSQSCHKLCHLFQLRIT